MAFYGLFIITAEIYIPAMEASQGFWEVSFVQQQVKVPLLIVSDQPRKAISYHHFD
jgi:hypothetical protein